MLNPEVDRFLREVIGRKHSTELDRLIEYDAFCARAEGKSQKTIDLTAMSLTKLKKFLVKNHLPTDARMISLDEIRGFILHLQGSRRFDEHPYAKSQERRLSGLTINSYLRAIRASFNRWVDEGLLETTPFEKVKIPKAPKRVIPTFSEEQLGALLGAIDTSTPEGFRDHLLILIYIDTACRLSEITNLKLDDVNLEERCLKIFGKGQKERIAPFGATVQKLLWKYVSLYRPEPAIPRCDYAFLSKDGRPLTKNRVEAIVRKYGQRAGIKGVRCSPHTLRHTACVMWIRNGGDIFSLQRITGHSSLEVLRGYINLAQGDVNSAHRRYSAIDNLDLPMPRARRRNKQAKDYTDITDHAANANPKQRSLRRQSRSVEEIGP